MKSFIVLAVLVACAAAAPASTNDKDAVVLRSELDNIGVDKYSYAYETSNGIAAQEQGQLQNAGTEGEYVVVRGSFSYVAPDGQTINVSYEAGPEGFKPQGAHIPV
ncbi:Flexible cuticle protein 12 [Eumeta japonica]|uniref:Flexible cuticle protein 12 n=1 Tax=Eumeta variegata TaxID=151549 RepID=A0A4C1T604_EUMVA|nr:Flexible cuticle protein 12 [Eumeta japonica]